MSDEQEHESTAVPLEGIEVEESKPAVFEKLLLQSLKNAVILEGMAELPPWREWSSNAEKEAAYAAWYRDIYGFLKNAVIAHFLIRLQENVPRVAEAIAAEVHEFLEAGDAYPEWVWQWATERGIDPEAELKAARTRHRQWLATPVGETPASEVSADGEADE